MATGAGSFAGRSIIAADQMKQRRVAKSRGAVSDSRLIYEQRKRDALVFTEGLRVAPVAETYRG